AANPDLKFFNAQRGYVRVQLEHGLWRSDFRVVPYIRRPGAIKKTPTQTPPGAPPRGRFLFPRRAQTRCPVGDFGKGHFAFFSDPDGNRISLHQAGSRPRPGVRQGICGGSRTRSREAA
ncbi:VOC family protein, partial [Nocardia brasiliensis]|uniref:VOC family protein n=1 Tax=Nocardia brasiliensis TaxID=37326 RepID=UPI0024565B04